LTSINASDALPDDFLMIVGGGKVGEAWQ